MPHELELTTRDELAPSTPWRMVAIAYLAAAARP
jgi:hypothetical protein